MTLTRIFRRSKPKDPSSLPKQKAVERISTPYATYGPDAIASLVRQTMPSSTCSTDLSSDEAGHESEHSSSDKDSLHSFLELYQNEFGRRMVEEAAKHPDVREHVRQVILSRPDLSFTADAVQHAARTWDAEMINFLVKTKGPKVHLTCGVVKAALSNKSFGVEVMAILQERGAAIKITRSVVNAAYENEKCGRDILMQLLCDPGVSILNEAVVSITALFDVELVRVLLSRSGIKITNEALVASARNLQGLYILEILLNSKDDVYILEDVAVAAAGNENTGPEMLQLLIDCMGKIPESERVWESAVRNKRYGRKITGFLFQHQRRVFASEGVIVAAASNTKTGKLVIDFLLEQTEQIVLTDGMILAASENWGQTTELIDMFLNKSANEVQITERIVPSLTEDRRREKPWMKNARSGMCDAIFYILNGKFKDRVSFTTDALLQIMACGTLGLISDLLDSLGEKISITEKMIEAAVGGDKGSDVVNIVQRLFEHNPSVKINEKTIILAAQGGLTGIKLLRTLFNHDSTLQVPPIAIYAAANDDLFGSTLVEILLGQTPTVLITESSVAAAAENPYTTLFDVFISRCKGEIRLTLQTLPHLLDNLTKQVKRILTEPHEALVTGPPLEEAVQIGDPVIVACILRNGENPRQLSAREAESAVGNSCAGKEITQMLLAHGFLIEISESVVRSAAALYDSDYEIMKLLLGDTERVRVTPTGAEAIAGLMPAKVVRLLFETREEIRVTTRVLEEAAKHDWESLAFLIEVLGEYPPITDGILQAAASNIRSLRWIYDNYGDEIECTQRAVEIAAGSWTVQLQFMLDQWGDSVCITTKVMEVIATTSDVCEAVSMLFKMRPGEMCLSDDFWIAFAGSEYTWRVEEVLEELGEYCDYIRITADLVAAALNSQDCLGGEHLLKTFLRSNKARVTASGVQAIARSFDGNMLSLLFERHGRYIHVTEQTLEAAAENHSGWEIVEFLVRTQDKSRSWCTDRVVEAAARNSRAGRDILELLLCEYPESRFATPEVLIAATVHDNKLVSSDIISLLLTQREDEAVVTTAVIDAAIANSLYEWDISKLQEIRDLRTLRATRYA